MSKITVHSRAPWKRFICVDRKLANRRNCYDPLRIAWKLIRNRQDVSKIRPRWLNGQGLLFTSLRLFKPNHVWIIETVLAVNRVVSLHFPPTPPPVFEKIITKDKQQKISLHRPEPYRIGTGFLLEKSSADGENWGGGEETKKKKSHVVTKPIRASLRPESIKRT